jgi:uncharacterized membrane protein YkoI
MNLSSTGRKIGLLAAGAIAGGILAGTVGAQAATTAPTPSASSTRSAGAASAPDGRPGPGGPHGHETALTGDLAAKVKAAALAKVPGATVDRVETDADGAAYEAHLTKADGSHVTVTFDKNLAVVQVQNGGPGGPGGRGPRGGRPHGPETALTGDLAAKVKAAALAKVPGATVDRVETDADGAAYEAHLTKADGSHVTVTFDKDVKVVEVQSH